MRADLRNISEIKVLDSHTCGEPTRVLFDFPFELKGKTLKEKLHDFSQKYDYLRFACLGEPRGYEAMVGALLCEPCSEDADFGVIFFNNAGYLGMCVHGTIGLAVTLKYLQKITEGNYKIDTPAGLVGIEVKSDNFITVQNVPSFRFLEGIEIEVGDYGLVRGDVAWGGNWFFLTEDGPSPSLSHLDNLTHFAISVRRSLREANISGKNGEEIDHIEIFGESSDSKSDSRNFVLCPGGEYDRSPCGTGTSAKLACLYASGKLKEGEIWKQASILNTIFEGSVKKREKLLIPFITGSAYITGETKLILQEKDIFCHGIDFCKIES